MKIDFRCDCPITSAIDVVGDKWLLVILKQMLVEHKQTFKDFNESDEAIATNILTAKLKLLEENGLVEKKNHPTNKKTKLYHLTDLGLSLNHLIVELAAWSDEKLRDFNPKMQESEAMKLIRKDKTLVAEMMVNTYKDNVLGSVGAEGGVKL